MKDRLGNFGDVLFGLLLAGILGAYAAIVGHFVTDRGINASTKLTTMWVQIGPLFQFVVILVLWAMQARVVSKLFVDNVLYFICYSVMLYFLFGWVMVEAVLPLSLTQFHNMPDLSVLATSPAPLISYSFWSLLILAVGGLAYHWFELSNLERYEAARDCLLIAGVAIVISFIGNASLKLSTPLDAMMLIALGLGMRGIFLLGDGWAAKKWATKAQMEHHDRLNLAGAALMLLCGLGWAITIAVDQHARAVLVFWECDLIVVAVASWLLFKQLRARRHSDPLIAS